MKNFTPILLIIISAATFFLFIDPLYEEVKNLLNEKEENNTMIDLAAELRKKREKLHQDFNNISTANKEDLLKLLPETVDNVRLILDIHNIADLFELDITNISVSGNDGSTSAPTASNSQVNTNPADSVGRITLGFSVVAQYDQFIELLRSLEESLRIVDVRSLTVSPGAVQNGPDGKPLPEVFYGYTVLLETYWLR